MNQELKRALELAETLEKRYSERVEEKLFDILLNSDDIKWNYSVDVESNDYPVVDGIEIDGKMFHINFSREWARYTDRISKY